MKTLSVATLLGAALLGCATLTPGGAAVKVFEARLESAEAPTPAMPDGCKRVSSWGPITQQAQERLAEDPYRTQRNETASRGGNILLVKSYKFMDKRRTDCPMGDNSPDCASGSQNWYKTSFDAFACDAPALQALSELKAEPEGGGLIWLLVSKKSAPAPTPAPAAAAAAPAPAPAPAVSAPRPAAAPAVSPAASALKAKILALMAEGIGEDVVLAYVRSNRLATPLTADEIIDWKKSGISDAVIRATFPG